MLIDPYPPLFFSSHTAPTNTFGTNTYRLATTTPYHSHASFLKTLETIWAPSKHTVFTVDKSGA